tara:strand:- start:3736 stop:3849 length:114 start_codon:yes stop_codon:yes gene_type:complete
MMTSKKVKEKEQKEWNRSGAKVTAVKKKAETIADLDL